MDDFEDMWSVSRPKDDVKLITVRDFVIKLGPKVKQPSDIAKASLRRLDCYMQVSVDEAQSRLFELIELVASGEEVIITDRGEPIAELAAIPPSSGKSK